MSQSPRTWKRRARGLWQVAGVTAIAASMACTADGRPGQANSFLMVDTLLAASGARPTAFGGTLPSDVQTYVSATVNGQQVRVPRVFEDLAQVTFRLAMKSPGSPTQPAAPATVNFITVRGYRVTFRRSDGRNTPGVDVPYTFDGALTLTVRAEPASATFVLVRMQAKEEAPLRALVGRGGAIAISTLAEITFFGADQAGRDVIVTAQISVNFADWGDPE